GDGDRDAGNGDGDGDGDAPPALTQVVADKRPLSATLADRFSDVTFGSDGKVYAAGYLTTEVSASVSDRQLAVARFTSTGELDTTFDGDGIATINVREATDATDSVEAATGIAVQADGKVLVAGTAWT